MIKKIILLIIIASPFIVYFFSRMILKKENKNYPIIKLTSISLILLIISLGIFRYYGNFSPLSKYTPPKYKDGKLLPASND